MKKVIYLLLSFLLFSCGVATVQKSEKSNLYEVLTTQNDGGASIRFYEILSEPREILMLQTDENLKNKIKPNDILTSNFVILNMGQKTALGYRFEIENVLETDKNIEISIKEIEPKSVSNSNQEITSPYTILKINSKKEILFK